MDSLGHILDLRNKDTCPSFSNMRKMDSAKIKELCVLAYTKQMEQLIDVEGSTVQLLRTLKSELREVSDGWYWWCGCDIMLNYML